MQRTVHSTCDFLATRWWASTGKQTSGTLFFIFYFFALFYFILFVSRLINSPNSRTSREEEEEVMSKNIDVIMIKT